MHCRAPCLRPGKTSILTRRVGPYSSAALVRWVCDRNERSLPPKAVDLPSGKSFSRSLESHKQWADTRRFVAKTRPENTKDVYIDDLSATLEAHRETNRASTIRKVSCEGGYRFRRLFVRPWSTLPPEGNCPNPIDQTNRQILVTGIGEKKQDDVEDINIAHEDRWHSVASREPIRLWQHWPADSIQHKALLRAKPGDKIREPPVLEYLPISLRPCRSWQLKEPVLPDESQWPWLAHVKGFDGDGVERLQQEIKAFETYTRLTPDEELASKVVAEEVKSVLEESFPTSTLSVVGSHRTGLATPTSDIDFSLVLPTNEKGPRSASSRKALRKMSSCFLKSVGFREVELVFARVPLVKAVHYRTGLKIQISTQPLDRYDTEFTANYLSEFPSLRPIFVLLRYALEMRNLNTPFEGGLGSYSLLMMIVAALKYTGGHLARDDAANHLLHVLNFYAGADLYRHGFCLEPSLTFNKTSTTLFSLNQRKPYLLSLQDPADPSNDLGRKAYAIKHVQCLFQQARVDMMKDIASWERKTTAQRQSIKGGILNRLVRANYTHFERERERVQNSMHKDFVSVREVSQDEELKAPDLSRRVSLKGLKKKGWAEEVNAERKRRGRLKREKKTKRKKETLEKRMQGLKAAEAARTRRSSRSSADLQSRGGSQSVRQGRGLRKPRHRALI